VSIVYGILTLYAVLCNYFHIVTVCDLDVDAHQEWCYVGWFV